jgi:hypothetical protein
MPRPRRPLIDGNKKQCSECREIKHIDQFYKRKSHYTGHDHYCIACTRIKARAEYGNNRERYAEYAKSTKSIEARRKFMASPAGRACAFAAHLKSKFGMTVKQYEYMYIKQDGVCAICKELNLNGKRLCIDHNHTTGQIRELLCDKCNYAIGRVKEDFKILDAMKDYLEKWQRVEWAKAWRS